MNFIDNAIRQVRCKLRKMGADVDGTTVTVKTPDQERMLQHLETLLTVKRQSGQVVENTIKAADRLFDHREPGDQFKRRRRRPRKHIQSQ